MKGTVILVGTSKLRSHDKEMHKKGLCSSQDTKRWVAVSLRYSVAIEITKQGENWLIMLNQLSTCSDKS